MLHVGQRVRVRDNHTVLYVRGCTGVIERSFGDLNCGAFEVRLRDGRSVLFWHHELLGEAGQEDFGPSDPERRKALGTVWIVCPHPVLALGLEGHLKEEARVHIGYELPEEETPSSIICCSDQAEDVASEVKRLREQAPDAAVLVLHDDPSLAAGEALRAGAEGFVHAGMRGAQIASALALGARGDIVLPWELVAHLIEGEGQVDLSALRARQREILGLVAEGLTDAQIAKRLFVSEHAVKQHLRAAYKVLKVKNRTEAAKLWSGLGASANS